MQIHKWLTIPDLSYEDPDQPQPAGEGDHDDIEQKTTQRVLFASVVVSRHYDSLVGEKNEMRRLGFIRQRNV